MPRCFEDQLTDKGRAVLAAYRKAVAQRRARPIPERVCLKCGKTFFGRQDLCEPCEAQWGMAWWVLEE